MTDFNDDAVRNLAICFLSRFLVCLCMAKILRSFMAFNLQVLGVQSDVLFPVTQQRELESLLKEARTC